jgi:hypothetical protein
MCDAVFIRPIWTGAQTPFQIVQGVAFFIQQQFFDPMNDQVKIT